MIFNYLIFKFLFLHQLIDIDRECYLEHRGFKHLITAAVRQVNIYFLILNSVGVLNCFLLTNAVAYSMYHKICFFTPLFFLLFYFAASQTGIFKFLLAISEKFISCFCALYIYFCTTCCSFCCA